MTEEDRHNHSRRPLRNGPPKPMTCASITCRFSGSSVQLHHIFRFSGRLGSDEPWNIIPLCEACHAAAHRGDAGFSVIELFALKYKAEVDHWRKIMTLKRYITDRDLEAMFRSILKESLPLRRILESRVDEAMKDTAL